MANKTKIQLAGWGGKQIRTTVPRAIAEAESALGPDDHATVALAERAAKARHVRLA